MKRTKIRVIISKQDVEAGCNQSWDVMYCLSWVSCHSSNDDCASVYTADLIGEAWNVRIAQNCRFEMNEQNNTALTSPLCFSCYVLLDLRKLLCTAFANQSNLITRRTVHRNT